MYINLLSLGKVFVREQKTKYKQNINKRAKINKIQSQIRRI